MKKIHADINGMKVNKWFVLMANASFFFFLAWLLPIHFEENDDVIMCMIANGQCSGNPDGHLVFINALYGWLLAGLYSLTKAVEWYTLSFCVLHILAMTGIVCVVLRNNEMKPLLKGLFLVFMYVIWARIIIGFQFTTTAGLLCFSGCIALIQPTKKWRIAGACAIFVSSLIRFEGSALVGILCFPLMLTKVFNEKWYKYWLAGVILLVMIGHWSNGLFYQQPDWSDYLAYNDVRGFINDNPNAALAEQKLPEGVELEDYRMFCGFVGDPQILTLPKLKMIASEIKKNISFRQVVTNLVQLRLYRFPLFLLYIGMLLCIMLNWKINKHSLSIRNLKTVIPITSLLLITIVLIYLGTTAYLKNRVFLCLLFPTVYIIVSCWPKSYVKHGKVWLVLIGLAMTGMVVKYAYQNSKVIQLVQTKQREFDVFQYPLVKNREDVLYLGGFALEYLYPFEIKDLGFRRVGLGWFSCIPFQQGVLECHRDFVDSEIICFCEKESPPLGILDRIETNYGIKPMMETIDKNEKYALYKFITK